MPTDPSNPHRVWLCACLAFVASACFFIAAALGRDPYYLSLVAAVLQWTAGFVWLFRLRPGRAASQT
jgi:hypothetical protein